MMKCVFALVLLHLCHSATSDFTLNSEMIDHLKHLNRFCKLGRVNFTSPANVSVPGPFMTFNPASCVGVFKNELRRLLDSITVHKDAESVVKKLQGNLEMLRAPAETDTKCVMKHPNHKMVFLSYKNFLQRLNNRK